MDGHRMNEWVEWDAQSVWHPYTQMQLVPQAIGVASAEGSYIELSNGDRILDGISSWWLTLHGHSHPAIAEAIGKQARHLDHVIFAGFTHEPAATLAHKLVEITPSGLEKVFFSDNGSTAVEVALKMCVQYWQHQGERRSLFLAIDHAYHGDTFGAMSVSASSPFTKPFEEHLFQVKRLPFPNPPEQTTDGPQADNITAESPFSEAEQVFLGELEKECRNQDVAGFIYEPLLLGAGGMLTWRPSVLSEALRIVRKHSVLAIADEVLTGFGRTGTMFASDQAELSPDVMTLSKGITGGFLPMGVTLATRAIFDAFLSSDRNKTFFHGHSYTGNPITCAAALASLAVFKDEPVWERVETITTAHRTYAPRLAERYGYRVRQVGTMAALEPMKGVGYLSNVSLKYGARALEAGLLLRPLGDTIYLLPPYSTTESDLQFAYGVIDQLLSESQQ
jgi:adenosylmethionine-8-amino-7-oxononanoate aminotransferase